MEYKRFTKRLTSGYPYTEYASAYDILVRLAELEDKIEQGTLIEIEPNLIGETIIGIHHFTDGTYQLDLDENLVIGFNKDEVVTWNNSHGYNDYFRKDLCFINNEKGRAEAEKRLKELQNGNQES